MTAQRLPTNDLALDDRNQRRRLTEIVNQLSGLLPFEQGSWTPVLRGSTTAGTYEIASNYSRYTRLGRRIILDVGIDLAAAITAGGAGYIQITGVPFTKASNTYAVGNVLTSGVDLTPGVSLYLGFEGIILNTALVIGEVNDNASNSPLSISAVAANDRIFGSICYDTDDR